MWSVNENFMIHQNTQSQSQLNQLDANEGVSNTRSTSDPPVLLFFHHQHVSINIRCKFNIYVRRKSSSFLHDHFKTTLTINHSKLEYFKYYRVSSLTFKRPRVVKRALSHVVLWNNLKYFLT